MTRIFCDICKDELIDENKIIHIKTKAGDSLHLKLEVSVSVSITDYGEQVNDNHVCRYCMLDAINEMDVRPKKPKSRKRAKKKL